MKDESIAIHDSALTGKTGDWYENTPKQGTYNLPFTVKCPACHEPSGSFCTTTGDKRLLRPNSVHTARMMLARKESQQGDLFK